MDTKKRIHIVMTEDGINLLDAELRRRNALAERAGVPQWSRSSLAEHLITRALNASRGSDLRGMAAREQIIERFAGVVPLDAKGNPEVG